MRVLGLSSSGFGEEVRFELRPLDPNCQNSSRRVVIDVRILSSWLFTTHSSVSCSDDRLADLSHLCGRIARAHDLVEAIEGQRGASTQGFICICPPA